ncbi:response regulator [Flammeovirga pacifica]|uniref:Response regulatory domain-containing protein n=1 Tax=Flammeovirga pacifica TaxID=915059 RepID=A0A1S1YTG2_FLAPC|nr:response regulator [Flammeovirga pacifica]OHX64317.1 hypothetical protein NH26_22240 [Flammeovirga pacifica]
MNKKIDCIMCIDDDEATNIYHKEIFKMMDVVDHLLIFDEAEKAIQYLLEPLDKLKVPNIILLDINMPRVNGWDFLDSFLRNGLDQKLKDTKIVVLSTSENPLDMVKLESYHCVDGFENKVLDKDKINSILAKY